MTDEWETPPRGLSPALRAFIIVDVILLAALLIFFTMSQLGFGSNSESSPVAAPPGSVASPSPTSEPVVTPTPTPTPTPSPTESMLTIPTPTQPGDPIAETGGQVFAMPSKNITCAIGAQTATCVIADMSTDPQTATGCAGVTGYAVRVDVAGRISMPCTAGAPDRAPNTVATLAYGDQLAANGFTCTSDNSGVTCINDATGHGFTMARRGITTF